MAYKIRRVQPSALAATEHCPRFRLDSKESQAALDGTLFHEFMEQIVDVPREQWAGWIATRETSSDIKGMLEEASTTLATVLVDDLPVFHDYRLRMRGGKPRKTPLKPGLYPECEIDRGAGNHGYIDLMVVMPGGFTHILDWKTNRIEKDFSLQLAAYAVDVNRLCPAHTGFVCQIVAPRLVEDAQLRLEIDESSIGTWAKRIADIEERADRSSNDPSIRGVPCDACEWCHWAGTCPYQASAALAIAETVTTDAKSVSEKTGRTSVTMALSSLVGVGGPYEGEVVSEETFTNPQTAAQRGLRRACLKFLTVLIDAAKDDDAKWCESLGDVDLKSVVPGFSISRVNGRSSLDKSRMSEIREAVMQKFGLSIEDVFDCSTIDTGLLAKSLVTVLGWKEKQAKDEIKRVLEPYSTVGAPTIRWAVKVDKTKAIEV